MKVANGTGPVAEMASDSCLASGVDHRLASIEFRLLQRRLPLATDVVQLLAACMNEDRISVVGGCYRSMVLVCRVDFLSSQIARHRPAIPIDKQP